jgi:hypothetical protein
LEVVLIYNDEYLATKPIQIKAEVNHSPLKWGFPSDQFWKLKIIDPASPLILLDPEKDVKELSFTRIGDNIR